MSHSVNTQSDSDTASAIQTLTLLVPNEPGVIARIVNLYTARGCNISSLLVTEHLPEKKTATITISAHKNERAMAQIRNQLKRYHYNLQEI